MPTLDSRVRALETRMASLEARVTVLEVTEPEPAPTPTPEPTPIPPPTTALPFTPSRIYRDQTFTNSDTALLLNMPDQGSSTAYINCTFTAGRYALWADHQTNLYFENCLFEDNLPNTGDEATVRLEDVQNVWFIRCRIKAHGPKHAFRIHGYSKNILVDTLEANAEGNGMMFGRYLNGPAALVEDLTLRNVKLVTNGPDCFDPKRDGSLLRLRIENMDVRFNPLVAWDAPADVRANPYPGWTITNLTSGPL